jgi:hypothetical protein
MNRFEPSNAAFSALRVLTQVMGKSSLSLFLHPNFKYKYSRSHTSSQLGKRKLMGCEKMLTKHWEPYFTFSSLQSVMILSIFSILLNGCGTPSATFGSVKIQGLSSWQETDLNVEEEGRYFKFPMTLTDLKDQSVPIRVFSDSNELLGESFVIPSYDSTDWKEFSVFIPLSSLRKIGKENAGFKIYAVSPKNPAAFVASEHYTVSHLDQEPITWQLKGVEADVEVGGGIKGIKIKFELTVFDKMGERLELIPFVNGYSIPDDEQNKYASIRFE